DVEHRAQGVGAGQPQIQHRRLVRVVFQDGRLVDPAGQLAADRVHLRADVGWREVGADVVQEGDDDLGDAFLGGRGDVVNAAERRDRVLDLLGDELLHVLRRGAVVSRHHGYGREVEVGEELNVELLVGHEPDEDHRQDQHADRHGSVDRETSECHMAPRSPLAEYPWRLEREALPIADRDSAGASVARRTKKWRAHNCVTVSCARVRPARAAPSGWHARISPSARRAVRGRGAAVELKQVLAEVPGLEKRFVYYLESLGYIQPTRVPKRRIDRRDYSAADVERIRGLWRYYQRGYALQAAQELA